MELTEWWVQWVVVSWVRVDERDVRQYKGFHRDGMALVCFLLCGIVRDAEGEVSG